MVRITADSTADLEELFKKENIAVMPLVITLGEKDYLDGETVNPKDIFEFYEREHALPKTAARSVEDYVKFFEELTAQGDEVVHYTISQTMSSSYNNALIAAAEVGGVYVVDSMSLSTGIGLLVLKGCDLAKKGRSAKEIFEICTSLTPYVQASFVVDTMEYLYKGGRCSGVAKFFAGALKIKPTILLKDGKMVVGQKYMGSFSKNIVKYVEATLSRCNTPDFRRIFITHTYSSAEDVAAVRAKIQEIFPQFEEIIETHAGCTVTSHCGKNTLGILYINKP